MYIFQIGAYDTDKLLTQVSRALEKRTELQARGKYPGMMNAVDKLNSTAGKGRGTGSKKFLHIFYIVIGVFLLIPGLVKPDELLFPLIFGLLAIIAGAAGLLRGRKNKKDPFENSAKLLLAGKEEPPEDITEVCFDEYGMSFDAEKIAYESFECVIETADAVLLVFDTRVVLLQKRDLVSRDSVEFCAYLRNKVNQYHAI